MYFTPLIYYPLSLTYPNYFLPRPIHQIPQHEHLLNVLKMNDSYSVLEGGGLDLQIIHGRKFMCSICMYSGNTSTYAVNQ